MLRNWILAGTLILTNTLAHAQLINISTRASVQTGDDVAIAGFIIEGESAVPVIIQATGPSLANAGVSNPLPDPKLSLFSGSTRIAGNDNWRDDANASQIEAFNLAPSDDLEAALYTTLEPGAYTVVVEDTQGRSGVGLVAVFADPNASGGKLVNLSTRAKVETGDSVLIGGLVIGGTEPLTVVVRGIGPSLKDASVAGTLGNPTITLFSNTASLGENDDWDTDGSAPTIGVQGKNPFDPLESALLVTLDPGAYTVVVSGVNLATGVGQVAVDIASPANTDAQCPDISGDYSADVSIDLSCTAAGNVFTYTDTFAGNTTIAQNACDIRLPTGAEILGASPAALGSLDGNALTIAPAVERIEIPDFTILYRTSGTGVVDGNRVTIDGSFELQGTYLNMPIECSGDVDIVLDRN
ncbi:MAG: hypothetical protein KDH88_00645 [Chromatiales bacterium]|nr:hypothetical protein [Chromatiales bacterium]